jgi:hypothetical protein
MRKKLSLVLYTVQKALDQMAEKKFILVLRADPCSLDGVNICEEEAGGTRAEENGLGRLGRYGAGIHEKLRGR